MKFPEWEQGDIQNSPNETEKIPTVQQGEIF